MSRMLVFAAVLVVASAAGCRKDGAAKPADVEVLPLVSSKAGGELILLPAGTFVTGDKAGRDDETPHPVSVSAFYLDKFLVTQELYEKVMGVNPSKEKDPRRPVEKTQWIDAVKFCNKCSELEELAPCYNLETGECNFAANGYRLPTEAEWEYACRAGSTGKYCFGDAEKDLPRYAWLAPESQGKTQPVGLKLPNRWGLYDMHGNVWEWCNDWYGEAYYKESSEKDPRGPVSGKMRVLRGGAWNSNADKCRAAYRHKEFPVYSDACFGTDSNGFRRARSFGGDKSIVVAAGPKITSIPAPKTTAEKKTVEPMKIDKAPNPGKIDLAKLKGTIVFVSNRSGSLKIWSMHASGKDAKQLSKSEGPDADPRFAPDGKKILYTTLRGGFPEIWQMNRDGADPKFVTKGSQGSWSPDGKSIVFIRDDQTYVRELASEKEKLISPKTWERCGVPAFSPDGQRIAVASRHLGDIGIFMLTLDGKETIPLKADEACCTPHWSKDGKKILCQSVKGHIHEVSVDGKSDEQLTFNADVQHDACYSPDGALMLYCRAPGPSGPWQIYVQRLDGGEEEFVPLTKEGSNLLPDWHAEE